jgi:hypothetical protein
MKFYIREFYEELSRHINFQLDKKNDNHFTWRPAWISAYIPKHNSQRNVTDKNETLYVQYITHFLCKSYGSWDNSSYNTLSAFLNPLSNNHHGLITAKTSTISIFLLLSSFMSLFPFISRNNQEYTIPLN